jgi:hypothetical protein
LAWILSVADRAAQALIDHATCLLMTAVHPSECAVFNVSTYEGLQKVSAQIELSKPAPQTVMNNQ